MHIKKTISIALIISLIFPYTILADQYLAPPSGNTDSEIYHILKSDLSHNENKVKEIELDNAVVLKDFITHELINIKEIPAIQPVFEFKIKKGKIIPPWKFKNSGMGGGHSESGLHSIEFSEEEINKFNMLFEEWKKGSYTFDFKRALKPRPWYQKPFVFFYRIIEWLASALYPWINRLDMPGITFFCAHCYEQTCVKRDIKLARALEKLYGDKLTAALSFFIPGLSQASMQGFSRSPLSSRRKARIYHDHLRSIVQLPEMGLEAFRESWISNIQSARDLGIFIENPAFEPRVRVQGFSLVSSLLQGARYTASPERKGRLFMVRPILPNRKALHLIKEKIDIHTRLIENNFAALEIMNLKASTMDRQTLGTIIELVEEMVVAYEELALGLDPESMLLEQVNTVWVTLKEKLIRLTDEDLNDPAIIEKLFQLENTGTLSDTTSLHEFINFIHQQSFNPLSEWAKKAEVTASLKIFGKRIDIIDVGSMPIITGEQVSSSILPLLLKAFDENQSSQIVSTLMINDDQFIGHLKLGLHRAEIQARFASPDEGGMIRVRYQEWGIGSGNRARLVYLKTVMEGLGLSVEITDDRFMTIMLDKDHHASSLSDIQTKFPLVVKALYYTRDLDLTIKKEDDALQAAQLFLEQETITPWHALDPIHEPLDPEVLARINTQLQELGLAPIPDHITITQKTINQYCNKPVEDRLATGEFIRINQGTPLERIIINTDFDPIERIIEDLASENGKDLIANAEILGSLDPYISFRNIGFIGKYMVQIGTFRTPENTTMVIIGLRNPETTNLVFARAHRKGTHTVQLSNDELFDLVTELGIKPNQIEDVPDEELHAYKKKLFERFEDQMTGTAVRIKGIASSPGKSGKKVIGRVSLFKDQSPSDE
ncbi:MAG: hypothetical protein GF384_00125, partial [Elusimicrobia bacterium]|nr:hypothetical protein [Elusimicrobiota bacterium]MBD3411503.1 hypothetical protein [Elusimicrobiota bacterium]